jgi:hypothetical protein
LCGMIICVVVGVVCSFVSYEIVAYLFLWGLHVVQLVPTRGGIFDRGTDPSDGLRVYSSVNEMRMAKMSIRTYLAGKGIDIGLTSQRQYAKRNTKESKRVRRTATVLHRNAPEDDVAVVRAA